MEHENRRQWERFLYPTELQLTAGGHVLPARLVDVSRQGMQVVAPVLLHPGDEVSASLPVTIPTPPAAGAVRGRVCWTAPARSDGTPQTRAGIVFEAPLSEAEALRSAVEHQEQAGSSVIVQFSGAMPQLMARAVQSDSGTRLRFALPFLREGSVITLHSQDDLAREMRVVSARLQDGGAQVELLVEPSPETRRRRFLQYDEPAPALQPAVRDEEVAERAAEAQIAWLPERTSEPSVPKRRMLVGVGVSTLASLAAACWIALRVSHPARDTDAGGNGKAGVATQSDLQAAKSLAPAIKPPARPPQLVSAPDRRAAPAPHTRALAAVSGTPPVGLAPDTAHQASAAPSLPLAPPVPAPVTEPAAAKHSQPPPSPPASALAVSTTKDTSEIFVPVTGSLAGLATKIWTDPPAVVVELPRGQIALGRKHYDIQKDGVVGISVGRPGGVTQLRVYVNSILSQYNATAVPGGVSIRIKRDLQSLP